MLRLPERPRDSARKAFRTAHYAIALVLLGSFNLPLAAQQPSQQATAPRLINKVEPQYTDEARAAGLQGTVVLRVEIGTDGKAHDFQVTRSLGMGLDEKAVEAARLWEFEPATRDGQLVAVRAVIEVNFRPPGLPADRNRPAAAQQTLPPGTTAPRLIRKTEPEYTQDAREAGIEGTVVLNVEIGTDGRAHDIRVTRSLDPGLDENAVEAVRSWEFEPGIRDGEPVAVTAAIEVNFRLN